MDVHPAGRSYIPSRWLAIPHKHIYSSSLYLNSPRCSRVLMRCFTSGVMGGFPVDNSTWPTINNHPPFPFTSDLMPLLILPLYFFFPPLKNSRSLLYIYFFNKMWGRANKIKSVKQEVGSSGWLKRVSGNHTICSAPPRPHGGPGEALGFSTHN